MRQQCRAVGPGAGRFQAAAVHAIIRHVPGAIRTIAAPRIRHDDVVARLERAHRAADGVNHAGAFMAIHGRIRALVITVAGMQIGLAQAARHHAHDDLVGARRA